MPVDSRGHSADPDEHEFLKHLWVCPAWAWYDLVDSNDIADHSDARFRKAVAYAMTDLIDLNPLFFRQLKAIFHHKDFDASEVNCLVTFNQPQIRRCSLLDAQGVASLGLVLFVHHLLSTVGSRPVRIIAHSMQNLLSDHDA